MSSNMSFSAMCTRILYIVACTTTEQAFGHLPKMNNNLGPTSVRDKSLAFSPGWYHQPGLKAVVPVRLTGRD